MAGLGFKMVTTSNTYDVYGNVATATDARGNATRFFYDDSTHALPTRVVVDPENDTGTQTTTTVYDTSTSLVTSQIDANNQESIIDYTNQLLGTVDPFGRPGVTKSPVININGTNQRRRTTTTYLDSSRQVIVATDLNAENDKLLKTRTTADMLGRPVLAEQTEDGSTYTISVRNAYLDMGRVTLTSSAMRSVAASTDSWTRVTKDTAGRVTEVTTFAGAGQPAWTGTSGIHTGTITTAYDAQFTTVTDQAGKVRRSMTDAAGRLRRIDEPNASGSLGSTSAPEQSTSYGYDVFDSLISVTQGSQTRTFNYDSLSRLRTAINPENSTTINPVTYQYDDNSNLRVKTDARGVSAHFEYDALNRMTRRWYNGSSSTSAITHLTPALPSGVGTTNEAKLFYDTQTIPDAPTFSRGVAVGRLVAQIYGAGNNGDYYGYDALGRQTLKLQQTGSRSYVITAEYALSGVLHKLNYPSGRKGRYVYDQAGRLTTFSGDLGDGTIRTYSSGVLYSPVGGLVKEQFGTNTSIYNKLFYNSRGQLAEIRESTSYTGPADFTADRGAIVNIYSNNCTTGICSGLNMSDNNGNLRKQQIHIPGHTMRYQEYDYDSLNRLNWVREVIDGGAEQWKQQFTYDRWGNRTINTGVTYGVGINNKAFNVNTNNNRLEVPGGQFGVMQYDAAGNLTNDTYTGAGNRTYDGDNKITSAWGGNNQAQLYGYDTSGQRIKRTVDGVETWQVYGLDGELLAEYPANGDPGSPQKEYGYRNGQLLITASSAVSGSNHSLSLNGTSAYVQVPNSTSLNITGAITVEAWVKPNFIGAYQHIVSRETYGVSGTGGGYELTLNNLGKARFDLYHSHNSYTPVIGNTVLTTGVWHHIAAVWDGAYMRLYVNGVLDASLTNGNGPASGTSSLKLGRNSGGNYYNGLTDEVRISNTAVYTSNFTPQTHLSATANTKALWKFNGQVVTDASTNGNNGTLQGGATYSTDVPSGSVSHSLSVDGATGYVQVANSSSLDITGSITVEAWIKPNSIGTYQYIVSRENYGVAGSGGGYELSLNNVGKARFDLYHSPTTYTPVIGNTTLTAGVWYHVAGVWDGSQMRVYLNGVLDGSLGTGNGPASGTNSLKLGRNSGGGYFNGLIDEVRVSNSAVYSGSFTPELQLTAGANTRGLWKFNNQNVLDSSSNSNNGTSQGWTGASTDVPTGPAYHSLSVNGASGYVQVPNSTSLNITGAITVEAWVKPNFIGAYQHIVSRETYGVSGTGGGYELTLNNLGKARFDLYHSHNSYTPVIGNTVLTTGVWHHIAAVWDGAYMRLYVNGVLDATLANGNGPASGTSSLKLGRNSGGNYYNGLIDEVRISNTAVYTSNFTPQTHLSATANTKGLWKFDGQVVTDASTNGNNGTLQSGATYSDDVPSGDGGGGSGGGSSSGGGASKVQWLVSDHLGTPRMIFDVTGRLDKMTRHDYLPFGEELFAPAGGRTSAMGYAGGDSVRQQFTSKERDIETGLDYFLARYYSSTQVASPPQTNSPAAQPNFISLRGRRRAIRRFTQSQRIPNHSTSTNTLTIIHSGIQIRPGTVLDQRFRFVWLVEAA